MGFSQGTPWFPAVSRPFICICNKDLLRDALRFLPLMARSQRTYRAMQEAGLKGFSMKRFPTWCDGEPVAVLTVVAPVHTPPKDVRRIAAAGLEPLLGGKHQNLGPISKRAFEPVTAVLVKARNPSRVTFSAHDSSPRFERL